MSHVAVRAALEVPDLTTAQKMVLVVLAERAHKDTLRCWPKHTTIAREASVTRETVVRCCRVLQDRGLIRAVGTRAGGVTEWYVACALRSQAGVTSDHVRVCAEVTQNQKGNQKGNQKNLPADAAGEFATSCTRLIMEQRGQTLVDPRIVHALAKRLHRLVKDPTPEQFAAAYMRLRKMGVTQPTAERVGEAMTGTIKGGREVLPDWSDGRGF